jgi:hypothetical protein
MGQMSAVAKRRKMHTALLVPNATDPEYARLWTDRWVSYPRAVQILGRISELQDLPDRVRMPNLLIHGPSGVGKSMIIAKFLRDLPDPLTRGRRPPAPVVAFQMPAMPTLRSFYSQLIRALDMPVLMGSALSELENDAIRKLKIAKPRLLIVDELHHLLACILREQRAALNTLKFLSNEFRISIVALGTDDALHVMRTDPQIASRFDHCALPVWTASEELRSFVAGFGEQLVMDVNAIANDAAAIDYLLDITGGVTGRIVEMIRLAARNALRCGKRKLTLEALQAAGREILDDLNSG